MPTPLATAFIRQYVRLPPRPNTRPPRHRSGGAPSPQSEAKHVRCPLYLYVDLLLFLPSPATAISRPRFGIAPPPAPARAVAPPSPAPLHRTGRLPELLRRPDAAGRAAASTTSATSPAAPGGRRRQHRRTGRAGSRSCSAAPTPLDAPPPPQPAPPPPRPSADGDALFGRLVDELLLEYCGEDDVAHALPPPPVLGAAPPVFPAVDEILGLFKHLCKELVDLCRQEDLSLYSGCDILAHGNALA